jgi:YggT family protein
VIAYVVTSLFFAFGARPPYFRWLDAVLDFLRDISEPLLRPFRKIIPQLGPLDLSPLVALIALQIVGSIVVSLIRG